MAKTPFYANLMMIILTHYTSYYIIIPFSPAFFIAFSHSFPHFLPYFDIIVPCSPAFVIPISHIFPSIFPAFSPRFFGHGTSPRSCPCTAGLRHSLAAWPRSHIQSRHSLRCSPGSGADMSNIYIYTHIVCVRVYIHIYVYIYIYANIYIYIVIIMIITMILENN